MQIPRRRQRRRRWSLSLGGISPLGADGRIWAVYLHAHRPSPPHAHHRRCIPHARERPHGSCPVHERRPPPQALPTPRPCLLKCPYPIPPIPRAAHAPEPCRASFNGRRQAHTHANKSRTKTYFPASTRTHGQATEQERTQAHRVKRPKTRKQTSTAAKHAAVCPFQSDIRADKGGFASRPAAGTRIIYFTHLLVYHIYLSVYLPIPCFFSFLWRKNNISLFVYAFKYVRNQSIKS